jgi:hypothetical protein
MVELVALMTSIVVLATTMVTLVTMLRKANTAVQTAEKAKAVAHEIHILVNSRLSEETERADRAEALLTENGIELPEEAIRIKPTRLEASP